MTDWWRVGGDAGGHGRVVAEVRGRSGSPVHCDAAANAYLIAAAPELLAACRELVAEFEADETAALTETGVVCLTPPASVVMAYEAIAKAEGKGL